MENIMGTQLSYEVETVLNAAEKKAKPKPPKRQVIGYLRVSTNGQDLENQKLGILALANERGWKVDFREEKASGRISYKDRDLGKTIEGLKKGDVLIVSELSRLGRSMLEIFQLLAELSGRGINVYSIKGGYVVDNTLQSKILTMVFAMAAEIERDLISQRTKEALAKKKAEGVKLGRPTGSLGTSKLDGKEEELRELVRKGVSTSALAKIYECSWPTMDHFLQTRGIIKERPASA